MIIFYNKWHNGDFITQIMLIQKLLERNPTLRIGCCAYANHVKLLKDMNIETIPLNIDMPVSPPQSDCIFLDRISQWSKTNNIKVAICNSWLGYGKENLHTWKSAINIYNAFAFSKNFTKDFERYGFSSAKSVYLDENLEDYDLIFSKDYQRFADTITSESKRNIYFDCSDTHSGHSHINESFTNKHVQQLWYDLFTSFPKLNFFTTNNTGCNLGNVFEMSNINIAELSFVSAKCDYIFGRGSGPYLCTFTKRNTGKKRFLLNFINTSPGTREEKKVYPFPSKFAGSQMTNIQNEKELFQIMQNISDNII